MRDRRRASCSASRASNTLISNGRPADLDRANATCPASTSGALRWMLTPSACSAASAMVAGPLAPTTIGGAGAPSTTPGNAVPAHIARSAAIVSTSAARRCGAVAERPADHLVLGGVRRCPGAAPEPIPQITRPGANAWSVLTAEASCAG